MKDRLNLLLVMAAVGIVMFGGIWIGLLIDRQTVRVSQPVIGPNGLPVPITVAPPPTAGFWPEVLRLVGAPGLAAGVLVLLGLALAFGGRRRPPGWSENHRRYQEFLKARAARVAMLEADPVRRRYAPLVARGEPWSDAQIAYDLDSSALATCVHLRPIEQRMRAVGVTLRFHGGLSVNADCRVDAETLKQRGLLAAPADYDEHYEPDRTPHDIPVAALFCHACTGSRINTGHSDESRRYPLRFAG